MEGPDSDEVQLKPAVRRIWPVIIVLLVGAVTAVALLVVQLRQPDPLKILIAVRMDGGWWEGSRPAAVLTDELAERFEKLGFSPLKGGDPEVTAALEANDDLSAAAKQLGAAFVISSELTPKVIEHPVEGGYFEARVQGQMQVAYAGEELRDAGEVYAWSGAKEKDRALRYLAESIANQSFDRALPELLKHPRLQALLTGSAADKAKLSLARGYVELREKRLAEAQDAFSKETSLRQAEARGPLKPHYLTEAPVSAALCDVASRGVLLHMTKRRTFFSPRNNELTYYNELERLVWRRPDGKEEQAYLGYNVYGYPSADERGQRVVLIEDVFGWAKTITLVEAGKQPKRLRFDPVRRYSEPQVSPQGGHVAVWDRACAKCRARLLVLSLPAGEVRYASPDGNSSIAGMTWLADDQLAFLDRPASEGERIERKGDLAQRLVQLNLNSEPAHLTTLHTAVGDEDYGYPTSDRAGTRIAMTRFAEGARSLALFDLSNKELSVFSVRGRPNRPAISPDGKRIVFELGDNIALYDIASLGMKLLTRSKLRQRYPLFDHAGKSVLFESRGTDPVFRRKTLTLVAEVKLP